VSPVVAVWLAAIGRPLPCLAAVAADSLAGFSRSELEEICRRRKSPHRLGRILRGYRQVELAAETLQVVGTAVFIGGARVWVWRQAPAGLPDWPLVAGSVLVGALALLAMEVWIPWAVARLWAAPLVYYTWPVWRPIGTALAPLVFGARLFDAILHRLAGRRPEPRDEESFGEEIRTFVTAGQQEGLLEEEAREMIEGVIQLGAVQVSQIMTPRTDMVSLPLTRNCDEVIKFAIQAEHTRIPVYNKTRDDIVGILYVKDLLPELAKPAPERIQPWSRLVREPYFVPETKPVDVLLEEFQRNRQHMAVVLDEYGGVSGLVSLEDVLEEIVGEIGDEYDEEVVEDVRELGDGRAEVLGRARIDEVNQRLGLDLPEDADFDTIGGFVFSELGHVPAAGEQVIRGRLRITVLEATSRRVERVRIEEEDKAEGGRGKAEEESGS